jgi:glycosyltransferase involved in cell wall biosynthesis
MRIAIVTDAWYPQVNGVVRTLNKTISLLESCGHEILCVNPGLINTMLLPTYPDIPLALFPYRKVKRLLDEFQPEVIELPHPIAVYLGHVAVEKNIEDFLKLKSDGFKVVIGAGPALEELKARYPAAYPVEGPLDIIKNGVNGWMNEDLQTAMTQALMVDRDTCRRFAEKYSWETSTHQFLSLIQPNRGDRTSEP